jgi:lipopolysaccharide exporter
MSGSRLDDMPSAAWTLAMPLSDINRKMAKGAAWMVSFKFMERGIGLASTLILARLLLPADFGLIAMAMAIIAALELLGAFSFDISLIQNPNAQRHHFDTAWTFNALFSLSCGVALVLLARPAALFYHEPRLESVMYLLAFGNAVQGFENIGTVAFRRDLRFDREFKFLLGKRLASFLVTMILAVWLRSYWALVFGQIAGKLAAVSLSYYVHSYRPRFSLAAKAELFHFSKWLMINNALLFLNSRIADFVIGKLAGAQALGLYSIAYEISNLPTTELVAPINRAAFPGYSRLAQEPDGLRSSFLNVISMIALFALPAGIGIALVADLLVPTILGWKWLPAIPLIQVLALYGIVVALQTNIIYVYLAVGMPRAVTWIAGGQLVLLLGLLLPATQRYGTIGAAWAYLTTVLLMLPVNQILISRRLRISVREYGAKLWRPAAACGAMAGAIFAIRTGLHPEQQTAAFLLALVVCVAVGALTYILALYGFWRMAACPDGAERFCLSRIEQALGRAGFRVNIIRH